MSEAGMMVEAESFTVDADAEDNMPRRWLSNLRLRATTRQLAPAYYQRCSNSELSAFATTPCGTPRFPQGNGHRGGCCTLDHTC